MPAVTQSALAAFAGQVTAHREQREWSKAQLASRLGFDASYVSHVENMTKVPTLAFARKCDPAFGLPGTFVALHKVLELGELEAAAVADVERDAASLTVWELRHIPGLLQTPAYMRAAMSTSIPLDRLEREMAIRADRQQVIGKLVAGWFIVSEAALWHVYGGKDTMRGQLEHLEDIAARPNIALQVMPFEVTDHTGGDGPLSVFEYRDMPTVMLAEGRASSRMSDDRDAVLQAQFALNVIRAAALSVTESVEYIQKVRETRYAQ